MNPETLSIITQIVYLAASVLFILGIKKLGKTSTAREGNTYSALAMLLAIVITLLNQGVLSYVEIFVTILIGSAIGVIAARRVAMTQMPEMVAIFNGFGGAASVFVASSEYWKQAIEKQEAMDEIVLITVVLSIIIGSVTLTGSLVAYGKLSGRINGNAIVFPGQHPLNLLLFIGVYYFCCFIGLKPKCSFIYVYYSGSCSAVRYFDCYTYWGS